MKYVALLRGINVGGNNIIPMVKLKEVVIKCGFTDVSTYIQSGNVLFESDEKNVSTITKILEDTLSKSFNYRASVVIRSHKQMEKILAEIPADWKKRTDIRCYVAFIKEPVTAEEVLPHIQLKEGVDFVKAAEGVIYMTTLTSGLSKSGFTKLIGKKIFQNMTMRNYNTTRKLLALMQK